MQLNKLSVPKPKNFLPRPYAIGQSIAHKGNVRPIAQAVGLGLSQDMSDAGIKPPLSGGPERNGILKRLSIKAAKVPKLSIKVPKVHIPRFRA